MNRHVVVARRADRGPGLRCSRASRWLVLLCACAATLSARSARAQETIVIEGGAAQIAPGQVIEDAVIVIKGERITEVGARGTVKVPANAIRVDATGKVVTAGFVDASSTLGLVEVEMVGPTNEGRFEDGAHGIHAAYRVTDGYHRTSVSIPIARTGGVTSVVATPRGGLVAGTGAWLTLGDSGDPVAKAAAAMYASLGESALGSAEGSRGIAVARVRELFDDARSYDRRRRDYERNQARPFAASRLDLEALLPVIRGRLPLVVRADRSSDIRAALALAAEFSLQLVIEGGAEAALLAAELARARVAVILDPTRNLPGSFDRMHVRDDLATVLDRAGVPVIISTLGSASNVRLLRQLAGVAVANGLGHERALAAVTTIPATVFGLGDRGALVRGAVADVVIWSGDPFELGSRVEHMFIGGARQSLRTRQTELFERYRVLPRASLTSP